MRHHRSLHRHSCNFLCLFDHNSENPEKTAKFLKKDKRFTALILHTQLSAMFCLNNFMLNIKNIHNVPCKCI